MAHGRPSFAGRSAIFEAVARAAFLAFAFSVPLDVRAMAGVGSITAGIGILLVAASLGTLLERGRLRRLESTHHLALALLAWIALSTFWSSDVELTLQRAQTFVQLVVFLLIYWQLGTTPGLIENVSVAYVGGATVAALGTLQNYLRGETYSVEARFAAEGFDPNDLGVTIAIGLPMAWWLVVRGSGWRRVAGASYVPLALMAVALTASRGAMLTVLAALIVVPALAGARAGRTLLLAVVVAAMTALLLSSVVPDTSWERLLSTRDQVVTGTMTHRTVIWSAGWEIFKDNWFLGVGSGAFPAAVEKVLNWRMVAHNTFLSVAVELGVVGVALFMGAWLSVILRARHAERPYRNLAYVLAATWMVGVASLSWEYRKTTWFLLGYLVHIVSAGSGNGHGAMAEHAQAGEGRGRARRPQGVM
jgi:O-antigen ligase